MQTNPEHICETRSALLKSAEALFIAHGYTGVSVRQITQACGANVASINYHFNDKTGLFREVLSNRLDQITQAKVALLESLDKQQPPVTLEQVLDVYIRSFFESHLTAEGDRLMQIIYREMGPDAVTGDLVAERLIRPINRAFKNALMKACPSLDDSYASLCASSITGQILHFMRSRGILRSMHNSQEDQAFIENIIQHIKLFSLHGLGGSQDG